MTVLMHISFIASCVGVMLTLWGAVELAILAERNRAKWMQQAKIQRDRKWLDQLIMSVR